MSEHPLLLDVSEIEKATQAKVLGTPKSISYSEFVYDSRKITPNSIFVCIPGNRVDGHDYMGQAVSKGAALILAQDPAKIATFRKTAPQASVLQVEDTLKAVQSLAAFYRQKFSLPAIGVAGSSGKTTTKDLIGSILQKKGPAVVTEGSFNNHWGLPQTVLKLRPVHETAVFELGTNHFGEVEALTRICRPNIGLITTIGLEHLEFLKNEQGVLRANQELFDVMLLDAKSPLFLINRDQPILRQLEAELVKLKVGKCLSFSVKSNEADVTLRSKKILDWEKRFGWAFEMETPWGTISAELPLPGEHNLANALAATLAALATGVVKTEHVVQGLAHPKISHLRSELSKTSSGALIYNDSYNANPTSFAALFEAGAALQKYSPIKLNSVIALVGDMLELGPESATFHRDLGRKAAESGVSVLFAVGQFAEDWVAGFNAAKQSIQFCEKCGSQEDLQLRLKKNETLNGNTLILVKGSRGSKMEETAEWLKKQ